jgi:hypothetical protein
MKELSDVLEKLNEKLLNKIEEWESCH